MSRITKDQPELPGLHALMRTILSPYVNQKGEDRISITGPDFPVRGKAITSLALIFNEFATNAAKYGSLSTEDGKVTIECRKVEKEIAVTWAETGAPPLSAPPEACGFGTVLMDTTISYHLGGTLRREWGAQGLTAHLHLPPDRLVV